MLDNDRLAYALESVLRVFTFPKHASLEAFWSQDCRLQTPSEGHTACFKGRIWAEAPVCFQHLGIVHTGFID